MPPRRRFLLGCALLAVALAAPAPIWPIQSGVWRFSNAQKSFLAAKSHFPLHNTRFRKNVSKSLRKTNLPTSATAIPSSHLLDAFGRTLNTVRRSHAFRPKEQKRSRFSVAALAGWITDHPSIQSKNAAHANLTGLDRTLTTYSPLHNTLVLKSNLGQYFEKNAAPVETSKYIAGRFRTSLPTADRMGLTGDICTGSSECADGRICTNGQITTCPSGENCFCVPSRGDEACTSSAECSTAGELCVQRGEKAVCFSEATATRANIPIVDIDASDEPEPGPSPESTGPGLRPGGGDGISGAFCTSSSECMDGRICADIHNLPNDDSCSPGDTCTCVPSDGLEACTSGADCPTAGEVCVQLGERRMCFSEQTATEAGILIVGVETIDDPDSGPGSGDGITGTICTSSSECAEERICVEGSSRFCSPGRSCYCAPTVGLDTCTSRDDCSTDGEVCVQPNEETRVCFSEEAATDAEIPIVIATTNESDTSPDGGDQATPANSELDSENGDFATDPDGNHLPSSSNENDEDEPTCIEAGALRHLSTNRLVFEKHAVSRVLCDENNSCATRGHMVVFCGYAMRMSAYCDSVGCKEAVMEVNNPRFKRGMRIESNTKGLEYTVFAARYGTQAEESLIRMALRLGM